MLIYIRPATPLKMTKFDMEKNYKINMDKVRNYFIQQYQQPLLPNVVRPGYENCVYRRGTGCDLIEVIPTGGNKGYLWIYTDMITNLPTAEIVIGTQFTKLQTKIDPKLAYGGVEGTILYGTVLMPGDNKQTQRFIIEDIFFYRGAKVASKTWGQKYEIYRDIFMALASSTAQICLPDMYPSFDAYISAMNTKALKYSVEHIKYVKLCLTRTVQYCPQSWLSQHFGSKCINSSAPLAPPTPPPPPQLKKQDKTKEQEYRTASLWTRADTIADIYHVYDFYTCTEADYKGMAIVPDYRTSVKMNNIFRTIKENANLDALEESDDEDEPTTFVDLTKVVRLDYVWNKRFKKWRPAI